MESLPDGNMSKKVREAADKCKNEMLRCKKVNPENLTKVVNLLCKADLVDNPEEALLATYSCWTPGECIPNVNTVSTFIVNKYSNKHPDGAEPTGDGWVADVAEQVLQIASDSWVDDGSGSVKVEEHSLECVVQEQEQQEQEAPLVIHSKPSGFESSVESLPDGDVSKKVREVADICKNEMLRCEKVNPDDLTKVVNMVCKVDMADNPEEALLATYSCWTPGECIPNENTVAAFIVNRVWYPPDGAEPPVDRWVADVAEEILQIYESGSVKVVHDPLTMGHWG